MLSGAANFNEIKEENKKDFQNKRVLEKIKKLLENQEEKKIIYELKNKLKY